MMKMQMRRINIFRSFLITIIIVVFFMFIHNPLQVNAAEKWVPVGNKGVATTTVSDVSLQVKNGIPYVSFSYSGAGIRLTEVKYNGTDWEKIGNMDDPNAGSPSLQIVDEKLYLAYVNYEAHPYTVCVKKYNGTDWKDVGNLELSNVKPYKVKLIIENGIPYIAYNNGNNDTKLTVMKYDGDVWETVGAENFTAGKVYNFSFQVSEGTPYVAYIDYANGSKLTVMKHNGTDWETVGSTAFSSGGIKSVSLKIIDNIPYVAYDDSVNDNKVTVMKYNGTDWETVGNAGFSIRSVNYINLEEEDGILYVAYQQNSDDHENGKKVAVMKFNGIDWETVGNAGFSDGRAYYISLQVEDGIPYVAYWDAANESKMTVMKYVNVIDNYTVNFESGVGGSLSGDTEKTFDEGYAMVEADIPTPISDEGYHFTGWTPTNPKGESVTANVTYTANFSNTYTVTYESGENGTIEEIGKTESVTYNNNPASVPTVTAKSGYKFVGWTRAGVDVTPSTVQIVEDTTFVAKYASIYDINFEVGLGGSLSGGNITKTFDAGYEIKESDIPTPISDAGYHFTGWTPTNPKGESVTANVTYTANFSNTYTVTYESGANGTIEEAGKTESVIHNNNPVTIPTVTPKSGYRFVGWTREGVDVTPSTVQIVEDTTFVAKYANIYDITFESGLGGSLSGGNVTKTFDSGYEIKEADIPTSIADVGYYFTGWTPSNPLGKEVNENVTYTVNFSNTYTVTYESGANGTIEEAGKTESVIYNNNPVAVPTVTAKEGYKFVGWIREGVDVTPSTVQIVEDITFEAKYVATYDITFESGLGGSLSGGNSTKTFDAGYEIKEADIPTPIADAGYHFTGWTPNSPLGKEVTENVTYTANFSNTYTVTYESGENGMIEEAGKTESVIHNNNPVAVPTVTPKSGYRFIGWTREGVDVTPSTVQIIEDTTFVAKYASNSSGGKHSGHKKKNSSNTTGTDGQIVISKDTIKKGDSITVEDKKFEAEVTFKKEVVKEIRSNNPNSDVILAIEKVDISKSTKNIKAKTDNEDYYKISVKANNKDIKLAKGDMTVTIPFVGTGKPVVINVDDNCRADMSYNSSEKLVTVYLKGSTEIAVLDVHHKFIDVENGWYESYVNTLVNSEVMNGTTDITFEPDKYMTRAEFVTTLARMSQEEQNNKETKFSDVVKEIWYSQYVNWAVNSSITTGTSESTFSPNNGITREQMATMLVRFSEYKKIKLSDENRTKKFSDNSLISPYALDAVYLMQKSGIINGKGENIFDPQGHATRAECAKMLSVLSLELS